MILTCSLILNRTFVTYLNISVDNDTSDLLLFVRLCINFTYTHNLTVTVTINTGRGSNFIGVDIFCVVQSGPEAHPPLCRRGTDSFLGVQRQKYMLTYHLFLMPACQWLEAIPPPHMSWGDVHLNYHKHNFRRHLL
jgi:hypothetical protein